MILLNLKLLYNVWFICCECVSLGIKFKFFIDILMLVKLRVGGNILFIIVSVVNMVFMSFVVLSRCFVVDLVEEMGIWFSFLLKICCSDVIFVRFFIGVEVVWVFI